MTSGTESLLGRASRRLRACVEAWPDCREGDYNPSCCRFPKSCSCTVYDEAAVNDGDLEAKQGDSLSASRHPYYASESNYYSNDYPTKWRSWGEFFDQMGDSDPDMNCVFRWDWWTPDEQYPDDEPPEYRLQIIFVMQRKGIYAPHWIAVNDDDEAAVRAWLTERWKTIQAIWEPISDA